VKMLRKLRKARELTSGQRWLLVHALIVLPVTDLGLGLIGVQRWRGVLRRCSNFLPAARYYKNQTGTDQGSVDAAQTIAWLVLTASEQGLWRPKCLPRAMTTWFLLRRLGIDSEIRFGARKEDGELEAHAWVECAGVALNEQDVELRFLPFVGPQTSITS
jgi:hypothetical protein